jgi:Putative addiction module component
MPNPQPLSPPPGFEQLNKDQQIDYVQQLWDLIITVPEEIPIPKWHLEILRDRIASQDSVQPKPWDDVKQRLLNKYSEY